MWPPGLRLLTSGVGSRSQAGYTQDTVIGLFCPDFLPDQGRQMADDLTYPVVWDDRPWYGQNWRGFRYLSSIFLAFVSSPVTAWDFWPGGRDCRCVVGRNQDVRGKSNLLEIETRGFVSISYTGAEEEKWLLIGLFALFQASVWGS